MTNNTSTANELLIYVNKLLNLSKPLEFPVEIKKGDYNPIIQAILPQLDAILALETENDIEGCINMLMEITLLLPEVTAKDYTMNILNTIIGTKEPNTILRLRLATNIFNKTISYSELHFNVLIKILNFAESTENIDLVSSYFDDVDELFHATKLTKDQRRTLYLAIADIVAKLNTNSSSLKELHFLDKYLCTFSQTDDPKVLESGKTVALRAIHLVLRSPILALSARVDIVSNPVVIGSVKSCSKNSNLYELLEIFSCKSLDEFNAFVKKVGNSFFETNKLVEENCYNSMRLLTLCSFPSSFEAIPFEKIAKALAIDEGDVEIWVVKAITQNLVEAKIDQLARTVVIVRSLHRRFDMEQWQEIGQKLQMYKKNVSALLNMVRNSRQMHAN